MSKLAHRRIILAKAEVTYNVDPVPVAATNAILCETVAWTMHGPKMNKRPGVRVSMGQLQQIYGGTLVGFNLTVEAKGSGAAGTAPELDPLLLACGLAKTVNAGVSVVYAPTSNSPTHTSATIYLYEDGVLWKITGCRGNMSLDLPVSGYGKFTFQMTGHLSAVLADIAMPTATYIATAPVPFINSQFGLGGTPYLALINALKLDLTNTVVTPPAVQAADGYGQIQIVQRNPKGTFDPELDTVAAREFIAMWQAGTKEALTTGAIGAVAGNKLTVAMPAIYYSAVAPGERESIITRSMSYEALEVAGDDEFSLTFA